MKIFLFLRTSVPFHTWQTLGEETIVCIPTLNSIPRLIYMRVQHGGAI